jgi:hypothetical protein
VLAPVTERERNRPNGTSGVRATRSSMTANTASSTAATASRPRVCTDPHGWVSVPTIA